MVSVIDPTVSVFGLVEHTQQQNMFINHRRTMSLISYEIENATLVDGAQNRIFSAFQYLSKFLPQVKRYEKLAQKAESVYVFGVADVVPPPIPKVTYVKLDPKSQLAKEWFLVSFGRDYVSALATEEQTQITDPDEERVFHGVWSFEFELVGILNNWLTNLVKASPMDLEERERNYTNQLNIMSNSMGRIITRIANEKNPHVPKELGNAVNTSLRPVINRS
jgi:DICT domain-containing protein